MSDDFRSYVSPRMTAGATSFEQDGNSRSCLLLSASVLVCTYRPGTSVNFRSTCTVIKLPMRLLFEQVPFNIFSVGHALCPHLC